MLILKVPSSGLAVRQTEFQTCGNQAEDISSILIKNYLDRTRRGIKQRYSFVVACCVYFVSICLGSPELLIKLFANSPGQSGLNSGPEVSKYQ